MLPTITDFEKMPDGAIVSRRIVLDLCAISDMTRWRLERRGQFPPSIKLSDRRVGYRVGEIRAWLAGQRDWNQAAQAVK